MNNVEIIRKKKTPTGWLVIVKVTSQHCGCSLNRRVIEVMGDEEPTKEIICKLL